MDNPYGITSDPRVARQMLHAEVNVSSVTVEECSEKCVDRAWVF